MEVAQVPLPSTRTTEPAHITQFIIVILLLKKSFLFVAILVIHNCSVAYFVGILCVQKFSIKIHHNAVAILRIFPSFFKPSLFFINYYLSLLVFFSLLLFYLFLFIFFRLEEGQGAMNEGYLWSDAESWSCGYCDSF